MSDKRMHELIDTAIEREAAAYRFYMDIIGMAADPMVKEAISWIAEEEKKHKAFLVQYRDGGYDPAIMRGPEADVIYYQIAEYQAEPELSPDMTREDLFLVAAHREARSHRFYLDLARLHPPGPTQEMLNKMALEELRHKEKMEYLYTNTAFPQTAGG